VNVTAGADVSLQAEPDVGTPARKLCNHATVSREECINKKGSRTKNGKRGRSRKEEQKNNRREEEKR
jgi:hypothetical protein